MKNAVEPSVINQMLSWFATQLEPFFATLVMAIGLLDSLPNYIRAALTALLLLWWLAVGERKIQPTETRFAELYRKSAVAILLLLPLFVLLFPGSRMAVFTDELPQIGFQAQWLWRGLLCLWMVGALASLGLLVKRHRELNRQLQQLGPLPPDDKLQQRLTHWQRRLGFKKAVTLCYGAQGRAWHALVGPRRIGLPNAAAHWPAAIQDVLLLQELCHYQKRAPRWHLWAQLAACCYWPCPWVQGLQGRLNQSLALSADELAEACYRDPLGYTRALRQIEQRMATPQPKEAARASAGLPSKNAPTGSLRRRVIAIVNGLRGYPARLAGVFSLAALPLWFGDQMISLREQRELAERHSDPYDRTVLQVGQAVMLAFVLTSVTLKEIPPAIEPPDELLYRYRFVEDFHRTLERMDGQRALGGNPVVGEGNQSPPVALPKSSS